MSKNDLYMYYHFNKTAQSTLEASKDEKQGVSFVAVIRLQPPFFFNQHLGASVEIMNIFSLCCDIYTLAHAYANTHTHVYVNVATPVSKRMRPFIKHVFLQDQV